MNHRAQAYQRATVETSSRERLMVLLFTTALKHMRHAAALLGRGEPNPALPLLTKASDIVAELAATLDARAAPELAATLGEVYTYVAGRLARAAAFRDATAAEEAARAFTPVVEGFEAAVSQLASQGAGSAP